MSALIFAAGCSFVDEKSPPSTSHADQPATSSSQATPSSPSMTDEPRTLEAAVRSGQESADRFTSGDYAGAWDLYSAAFQRGVSRSDYDKLGKTCDGASGPGLLIRVKGARLEGSDKAIVRLTVGEYAQSRTMTRENGQWRQEPNPDFAKELGKPIASIIVAEKAAGNCTGGS